MYLNKCICDLCGKDIDDLDKQSKIVYVLPYHFDEENVEVTDDPESVNLCKECLKKVHAFCKTLDKLNGYAKD